MAFEALINFFFVTGFLFIFTCKALPRKALLHTIFSITYSRICRSYLPREFAAGICRGNLPQGICHGYLTWVFCICKQIFFVYMGKFCLYESKLFLYVSKFFICETSFINSVSFCYYYSHGPPQ